MEWLDKAIRKHGGYRKTAMDAGISEHHLRNAGSGRRALGMTAVTRLAEVLPRVPKWRWLEALSADNDSRVRRREATASAKSADVA